MLSPRDWEVGRCLVVPTALAPRVPLFPQASDVCSTSLIMPPPYAVLQSLCALCGATTSLTLCGCGQAAHCENCSPYWVNGARQLSCCLASQIKRAPVCATDDFSFFSDLLLSARAALDSGDGTVAHAWVERMRFDTQHAFDSRGRTLLHAAVAAGDTVGCDALIALLVAAHVPIDAEDADGWRPLDAAAACGGRVCALTLLALGANAEPRSVTVGTAWVPRASLPWGVLSYESTTFVHALAACNAGDVLTAAMHRGVDIAHVTRGGSCAAAAQTPLISAVAVNAGDAVEALIAAAGCGGGELATRPVPFFSRLPRALVASFKEASSALVAQGGRARFDSECAEVGWDGTRAQTVLRSMTPLFVAVDAGYTHVVKSLLRAGADPCAEDGSCVSLLQHALMCAARNGGTHAAWFHSDAPASVFFAHVLDRVPPHRRFTKIARKLIRFGARLTGDGRPGHPSPLACAADMAELKMVTMLLRLGASSDVSVAVPPGDADAGWTPMHFAAAGAPDDAGERAAVVRLLLSEGGEALLDAADAQGRRPRDLALSAFAAAANAGGGRAVSTSVIDALSLGHASCGGGHSWGRMRPHGPHPRSEWRGHGHGHPRLFLHPRGPPGPPRNADHPPRCSPGHLGGGNPPRRGLRHAGGGPGAPPPLREEGHAHGAPDGASHHRGCFWGGPPPDVLLAFPLLDAARFEKNSLQRRVFGKLLHWTVFSRGQSFLEPLAAACPDGFISFESVIQKRALRDVAPLALLAPLREVIASSGGAFKLSLDGTRFWVNPVLFATQRAGNTAHAAVSSVLLASDEE